MNKHISLVGALSNREYLERQIAQLDDQAAAHLDNLIAVEEEIRNRIKGGETTGDHIDDMFLVDSGFVDADYKKNLLRLQSALAGATGQPILRVIEAIKEIDGGQYKSSAVCLGVLTGDSLVVDTVNGYCTLPVQKESFTADLSFGEIMSLSGTLNLLVSDEDVRYTGFIIGIEAVIEWFRSQEIHQQKAIHVLYAMAKEIGLELPEIPELPKEMKESLDSILDGSVKKWGEVHPEVD